MKQELQEKLFKKFPKIFQDRKKPMTETCMCWGIATGDGWYWLINNLCEMLQWDTDRNRYPQVVAMQVKEKFGTLRFYTNGHDSKQDGMIDVIEFLSGQVCEECGSMDGVTQTKGWVVTLCKKCMKEYKKKHA